MDKRPEIRTKRTGLLGNEDGIMAVIFALLLPVFVVIAALAIDMGYSYWKRNIVQVDASVSALAGAGVAMDDGEVDIDGTISYTLIDKNRDGAPDNDDSNADGVLDGAVILIEALAYAEKTIAGEDILATVDVLAGNWDLATRVFTRAGTWDPDTQVFTIDPAAYDTATRIWTAVSDPIVPLNAVMTTTRRADDGPNNNPLPLFLAAAVGMPDININTTAIATIDVGEPIGLSACITALNRTEDRSFYINGTAEVLAPGCDIDIYSSDVCALYAVGNPGVSLILTDADGNILEEGEINIGGSYCVTPKVDLEPDEPNDYLYAESTDAFPEGQEPFSYIYPPGYSAGDSSTCDKNGNYCGLFNGTIHSSLEPATGIRPSGCDGTEDKTTFGPGNPPERDYVDGILLIGTPGETTVFCGGIDIDGPAGSTVVFAGNFVISGGEFDIKASVSIDSNINGTGFYLMDAARINWHGSPGGDGAVGLVAQYSGALKDFVFFEDVNSVLPDGVSHSLRGTPLGAYDGILYFQNSDVEFKGTADAIVGITDGGCSILIADEIYFNGTTLFAADSSGCGGRELPPAALAELALRLRS